MKAGKGDAEFVADLLMQPVGASMPLISEKKGIAGIKLNGPEVLLGMGCEEPDSLRKGIRFLKIFPGIMYRDIQMPPVIHATTPEIAVLKGKPEWAHQMKPGAGKGTQAADISRILRNFRLEEDDIQYRAHLPTGDV